MSTEKAMSTKDVIRSQLEAFNRHDTSVFADRYAADAVVADPQQQEPLRGNAAISKDIADWFNAFPDIEAHITRTVIEGTAYAAEWTMTGTHEGPLVMPDGQVPATGRKLQIAVAAIGRLDAQGRIVEEHRYYNLADIMSQLGLMQ